MITGESILRCPALGLGFQVQGESYLPLPGCEGGLTEAVALGALQEHVFAAAAKSAAAQRTEPAVEEKPKRKVATSPAIAKKTKAKSKAKSKKGKRTKK